ncbi:MAG: histidine kinase, partial [Bacteroidota bacterium]|nr:histidine kinase [Bacteroidota bacterium]
LVLQAGNISHEFTGPQRSLFLIINPAFWNTWWFRLMMGLLLVGGIYTGIRYRLLRKFRLRMQHAENEKQLADMRQKTAELKQQATDLEMQALRAQMNPHFIFNSLNSINRFILQNNRLQASEYLTKFSRLIRLILQNSQAVLITLESEIESVKLYLSLESLRFDYHFDYKLSLDPDLDLSMLKVPPLIIQPYIENAIWHGLMHKEEKGQLDIEISLEKDDLYFKIIDNGIGRKQASALTSKSATRHKPMGLNITAHRIALMHSGIDHRSSVIINDLVNADGTASGTEVIIRIPVIQ